MSALAWHTSWTWNTLTGIPLNHCSLHTCSGQLILGLWNSLLFHLLQVTWARCPSEALSSCKSSLLSLYGNFLFVWRDPQDYDLPEACLHTVPPPHTHTHKHKCMYIKWINEKQMCIAGVKIQPCFLKFSCVTFRKVFCLPRPQLLHL